MATATTYTYAQLEQLWINAGGPSIDAPTAAAIALAESSGNPSATNANDSNGKGGTQSSWGLWQISNGTHSQPVANILTPTVNAQQAVAKYKAAGNSFSPWGTYSSGAYKTFLSPGTTPDPNVPATSTTTLTAAVQQAAAASSSTCLIGFTSPSVLGIGGGTVCLLSKQNMRAIIGASMIMAGGTLVLAGAVLILAFGIGQSPLASRVASMTPAGKVVKAVS